MKNKPIIYSKEGWLKACNLLLPGITQEQRDELWASMQEQREVVAAKFNLAGT